MRLYRFVNIEAMTWLYPINSQVHMTFSKALHRFKAQAREERMRVSFLGAIGRWCIGSAKPTYVALNDFIISLANHCTSSFSDDHGTASLQALKASHGRALPSATRSAALPTPR